jgi:HflK protein
LGGLFTDPAGWVRNVGGALDYQFGFKVSETWLYRFLEGALLPLVIFQLVVLYLLSSLVFLGPEEEGIVERFGKPRAETWHLESGFHLKLPWPFETVRRFPVKRLQNVDIGFHEEAGKGEPETILWNVPHYQSEEQFLTASREAATSDAVPVSLVSFNIRIEYQITDLFKYAYRCSDPHQAVQQLAYRTITLTAANRGLSDVLGEGRQAMAQAVQEQMQRAADALGIGIRIAYVGVQGVHPPVSVADAFQSVIGATEEKEASILKARADANRVLPLADAAAMKTITNAAAYAVRRAELSSAEADRFVKRLESYRLSPEVFKTRLYLGALRDSLTNARKYIIAASPATEVIQLNLEEKLAPDLFDLGPGSKVAGEKGK